MSGLLHAQCQNWNVINSLQVNRLVSFYHSYQGPKAQSTAYFETLYEPDGEDGDRRLGLRKEVTVPLDEESPLFPSSGGPSLLTRLTKSDGMSSTCSFEHNGR